MPLAKPPLHIVLIMNPFFKILSVNTQKKALPDCHIRQGRIRFSGFDFNFAR